MKWKLYASAHQGFESIFVEEDSEYIFRIKYTHFPSHLATGKMEKAILALLNGESVPKAKEPAKENDWVVNAIGDMINAGIVCNDSCVKIDIIAKCIRDNAPSEQIKTFVRCSVPEMGDKPMGRHLDELTAYAKEQAATIAMLAQQLADKKEIIRRLTT